MQKRRLQVFVSSTYEDMKSERQAAVSAILESGHIPAGMELFTAGDESQMTVIKRWIEESDVFLLVLGARYGSIEKMTKKSYIHLEYEYAASLSKPHFSLVLDPNCEDDRVRRLGLSSIERNEPEKFRQFRKQVSSKLVKFWTTEMDIKLAIFQKMAEYDRDQSLAGWVPSSEITNVAPLAEEIARLTKENSQLRKALAEAKGSYESFGGLSFDELLVYLGAREVHGVQLLDNFTVAKVNQLLKVPANQPAQNTLLHVLMSERQNLRDGCNRDVDSPLDESLMALREIGLLLKNQTRVGEHWSLSSDGRRFLLRVEHSLDKPSNS